MSPAVPAPHLPLAPADVRRAVKVPVEAPRMEREVADVLTFTGLLDSQEHLLLGFGGWRERAAAGKTVEIRMHSECLTGDVFGSARCDCGPQLHEAMKALAENDGVLLYLRQEGRGIGLYNKLDAYALQDTGLDTYAANEALGHGADERDYTAAAQMLVAVGITDVDLLTNNPDKVAQLRSHGITVSHQVHTGVHANPSNVAYLRAKRDVTGHTLDLSPAIAAG
ncbi:GTP cyclohydrolase II [Nocardioides yefusunii]|uniref:GTP cyclohydrolase-2 n=1 Tax=Nocardioides yefusunii TaxID=2500546 RepID=A0ABW1QTP8_9ACTN|nr:GTP cyclohydrolase II [Nocardioides yefusunii]